MKGHLEEILVSIPELPDPMSRKRKPTWLWHVYVEIHKTATVTANRLLPKRSTMTALLNVMIVQDQAVKEFQLPGIHAAEQARKKMFIERKDTKDTWSPEGYRKENQALARNVTMCPGKKIDKDSKLQIILVSTSQSPIDVTVLVTLKEEGGSRWKKEEGRWKVEEGGDCQSSWRFISDDGNPRMQMSSKFEFSNPLIHTVRFDQFPNHFPNEDEHYIHLRIESDKDSPCFCSLLSIQKAECPYCDTVGDAQKFGRWQTMDSTSSMVIDANEFVTKGKWREGKFLIVLIGVENEVCNFRDTERRNTTCLTSTDFQKKVNITLEPTAKFRDRLKGCSVIFIYGAFAVFCYLASVTCFNLDNASLELEKAPEKSWLFSFLDWNHTPEWLRSCCRSKAGRSDTLEPSKLKQKSKTLEKRTENIANPEKSKARYKKNQLFLGTLLLISIFYAVTVLQTAFHAQKTQHRTGNNDICFYNARCQNPLQYSMGILDFNHFYSNIGYVMLGITFNLIVYWKSKKYQKYEEERQGKEKKKRQAVNVWRGNVNKGGDKAKKNEEENQKMRELTTKQTEELTMKHGVPFLTGVYYSMGTAMAMEGLMSAAYHICPTTVSFQYDTTFMYTIAILIFVKLYQVCFKL